MPAIQCLVRLFRIGQTSSNGVLAIPARVINNAFALSCFIGTIVAGLFNGNHPMWILGSACAVAIFAWLIGLPISALLLRCVNEEIERHRAENPIPDEFNTPATGVEADAGSPHDLGQAAAG